MMENEVGIQDLIKQYIVKATFSETDVIQNDTKIFEQGLLDSMGLLLLIDFIKEKFTIEVKDDELLIDNFESVDNIASFIKNKKIKTVLQQSV